MDKRIEGVWDDVAKAFLANEEPAVVNAFSYVSDIAKRRFCGAAVPVVDDPQFASKAPTFARLCCLEAAHAWLKATEARPGAGFRH